MRSALLRALPLISLVVAVAGCASTAEGTEAAPVPAEDALEVESVPIALVRMHLVLQGVETKEFPVTVPTDATNVTYSMKADNMLVSELRIDLLGCGSDDHFLTAAGGELGGSLCDEAEAGNQVLTISGRSVFDGEFALYAMVPEASLGAGPGSV